MARKKQAEQLTPLELDIMKVLWEQDGAGGTVQTVVDKLKPSRELAYTTVQTMLNVLLRKGKVERLQNERAYVYKPVVSRANALQNALGDLVDRLFGGSAESLVMNLVETRRLTPEKLDEIRRLIERPEVDDGQR
jgi:BlaI family transcriptional regulator, penicillinase repressor